MKMHRALLASAAALSLVSCGLAGGDPAADGLAAYDARDYRAARIALANAVGDAETRTPEVLDRYARTLLALEDGEAAERVIAMLRDSGSAPDDVEALAGHAALLRGDYTLAMERAEEAPTGALAEWVAIRALGELGRNDEAIDRADDALEQFPQDARLLAMRGAMAIATRQVTAAKEYSARALAADPVDHDALMLAGQLRVMRGDWEEALRFYETAHEEHPSSLAALFALAATEADMGNEEAAAGHLETILAYAPGHPLALLLDAKLAFAGGDLDRAQEILQSQESEIGKIPQGRLLMGEVAYLRGLPAQAIAHLERFLHSQPGHMHASTVLARAMVEEGSTQEAWRLVAPLADSATATPQLLALAAELAPRVGEEDRFSRRVATSRPDDFGPRAQAAQAALQGGEAQEAERLYAALLADGGESDAVILNNAAHAALELGNTAEALRRARQAHELAPRDPRVADTLGWMLLENGQRGPALTHLARAVEGAPGNLQIRWHYANALLANGRNAEARRIIQDLREYASGDQREAMDALLARI